MQHVLAFSLFTDYDTKSKYCSCAMYCGTRFFCYQKLVLFVTGDSNARDSNAALPLAVEICTHTTHHTRSLSSANKLPLLIYSLIIIVLIFITLVNTVNLRKKTHNHGVNASHLHLIANRIDSTVNSNQHIWNVE